MFNLLYWIFVVASFVVIGALVKYTIEMARALSNSIDDYHDEIDAKAKKGEPVNPYLELSMLFSNQNNEQIENGDTK